MSQSKENSFEITKMKKSIKAQILKNNFQNILELSQSNKLNKISKTPNITCRLVLSNFENLASFDRLKSDMRNKWIYEPNNNAELNSVEVNSLRNSRESQASRDRIQMYSIVCNL